MQVISIISALIAAIVIILNYDKNIDINIINQLFSNILGTGILTKNINLAIFTLCIFILGEVSAITFFFPLYKSLKEKFNAYKRELEKGSITNTSSEAKIQVLENKITVLEKALDDALNRNK